MGLDVAVFRRKPPPGNLKQDLDQIEIDHDSLPLISRHLDNVSHIAWLRDHVAHTLDPNTSLILLRILYSGSHSGDQIPCADLPELRKEVESLRMSSHDAVKEFANVLREAIDVAQKEGTPIVFC